MKHIAVLSLFLAFTLAAGISHPAETPNAPANVLIQLQQQIIGRIESVITFLLIFAGVTVAMYARHALVRNGEQELVLPHETRLGWLSRIARYPNNVVAVDLPYREEEGRTL